MVESEVANLKSYRSCVPIELVLFDITQIVIRQIGIADRFSTSSEDSENDCEKCKDKHSNMTFLSHLRMKMCRPFSWYISALGCCALTTTVISSADESGRLS
jgi:hypothetical protein